MQSTNVDVAIIGTGTAGLNARREVEKASKSYVMIERAQLGTTCARVGCMPSKLLIAAADAAHQVAGSHVFGVEVPRWDVNGPAVMRRVQQERDRFVGGVVRGMESTMEHLLRGEARFTGPDRLQVNDDFEVRFTSAVIATGASAWMPPALRGLDDILTNEDIFDLEDLPESLAVFGTGVIAIELGQAMHRLGVDVHFFNPFDELLGVQDPEIASTARDVLAEELNLHLGVDACVEADDGRYIITWNKDGQNHERAFERVLAAAGRRPNLEALDLAASGVALDDRGRPADWDPQTTRIGESNLFIAGDCAGYRPILHEASDEGVIAGRNAASFPESTPGERRVPLGIVFTDPNVAFVGERFADLDHDCTAIGQASFDNQGRARVNNVARGLVRLYANLDEELIGAELIAPDAEHLAHTLAWAVAERLTVRRILRLPFYHPTLEEGVRTAARSLAKALDVQSRCPAEDLAQGPGA